MTARSQSDEPLESEALELERQFFLVKRLGEKISFEQLDDGDPVAYGAEVLVQMQLRAKEIWNMCRFPIRASRVLSRQCLKADGHRMGEVAHYLESRDSLENIFIPSLRSGRHRIAVYWRAATAGTFHVGPASVQSVFSPAIAASTAGFHLQIKAPSE